MVCPGQQMAPSGPCSIPQAREQGPEADRDSSMNGTAAQPDGWRPLLKADWTRFFFIHYSLPPEILSPYTPLELDCRDGRAFVSLVFFRFERMRPACFLPDRLGRILFRPASNNWFLNVRTYVRGGAGPGIQFLVEWMDNSIGLYM